jgi:hypothetical protein
MTRTPAPPRDLMDAMGAAARDGDTVRSAMLKATYKAWLRDKHGIIDHPKWEDA